jgi:hypothetical protein
MSSEGIEIAGLESDEKADRTQQNEQEARMPEGEFLCRLPFDCVGERDRRQTEMEEVGVRPHREGGEDDASAHDRQRQAPPADKTAIALPRPGKQQNPAENGGHRDIHGRHCLHVEMDDAWKRSRVPTGRAA